MLGKQTDLKWNRKTNFHVLLSDTLPPEEIETEILSRLNFDFQASPGEAPEQRALTKDNLEKYGQHLIKHHASFQGNSPLAVGICNASVDANKLAELLSKDSRFRNKYLFALPCDEDLSIVSWNSSGYGFRKNLIQQSHLIFSSNPKTRSFLLGNLHETQTSFKEEFRQTKACIWGSDAHEYDKLFKPEKNRLTWIKADLTFDGLKQVVFEPESRVAIQETCPDQKTSYEIIDSVQFIDNSGREQFTNSQIHLNPNLTSIIGGKSSGKSLLLYHIARTANPEETDKKTGLASANAYLDLAADDSFDFKVTWGDGTTQTLKNPGETKSITYIPQLYINELAEKNGRPQLNELVQEIIFQDDTIKNEIEGLYQDCERINEEISTNITRLTSFRQQYKRAKQDREKLGNTKSIEQEIKKITTEIGRIQKSSGFSPEENNQYNWLVNRLNSIERRTTALRSFSLDLSDLQDKLTNEVSSATTNIQLLDERRDKASIKSKIIDNTRKQLIDIQNSVKASVSKDQERVQGLLERLRTQESQISDKLKKFSRKIQGQKELKGHQDKLRKEQNKLSLANEANKNLKTIFENGKQIADQIRSKYSDLFNTYNEIETQFNRASDIDSEHIKLKASLDFDLQKFDSFIFCFDGRGSLSNTLGDYINGNNRYEYQKDSHLDAIFSMEEKIRNYPTIEAKVRNNSNQESVLRNLLQDCFYISFDLLYKDDDIISMSPGKRGMVLLNLVLHLSNSSHPILIDQPEDNLDNRTVYNELRDFMRERKRRRQIIMVTHNANMVVSTDSESVIVANQSGQQHDMVNEKYRFEYVTGAIECTFSNPSETSLLKKYGIREHICEVLEGGQTAFEERERKYSFHR